MTLDLATLTLDEWATLSLDGWSTMVLDPVPSYRVTASQYRTGGSRMGQAVTRDTAQLTTGHSEAGETV